LLQSFRTHGLTQQVRFEMRRADPDLARAEDAELRIRAAAAKRLIPDDAAFTIVKTRHGVALVVRRDVYDTWARVSTIEEEYPDDDVMQDELLALFDSTNWARVGTEGHPIPPERVRDRPGVKPALAMYQLTEENIRLARLEHGDVTVVKHGSTPNPDRRPDRDFVQAYVEERASAVGLTLDDVQAKSPGARHDLHSDPAELLRAALAAQFDAMGAKPSDVRDVLQRGEEMHSRLRRRGYELERAVWERYTHVPADSRLEGEQPIERPAHVVPTPRDLPRLYPTPPSGGQDTRPLPPDDPRMRAALERAERIGHDIEARHAAARMRDLRSRADQGDEEALATLKAEGWGVSVTPEAEARIVEQVAATTRRERQALRFE
jgi:hypothetical protein